MKPFCTITCAETGEGCECPIEEGGSESASVTGLSCSANNGDRKFSQQYLDQLENLKNGVCVYCREPLLTKRHCKKCAEKVRIRQRNRYRKKVGIKLDTPLRGRGRARTIDNEEVICRKISKFYEGKDWHKLSLEEREIVGDLVQAGWLSENRPVNGFVGKISK